MEKIIYEYVILLNMPQREVKFGLIRLSTNGFDRAFYEQIFHKDDIPINSEHPINWQKAKLKELAIAIKNFECGALGVQKKVRQQQSIADKNSIAFLYQTFRNSPEGYDKSQGFFHDFTNAFVYCEQQIHIGLHPHSHLVHSDLFIRGEGEEKIKSEGGIEYKISPSIWIEGLQHSKEFCLNLEWPIEVEKPQEKKKFKKYLMSKTWTKGFAMMPEYYQVSTGGTLENKLCSYKIEIATLGAYAQLMAGVDLQRTIPIAGTLRNLEAFCYGFINQLDGYFEAKKVNNPE